jgi:hypothetical protein
MPSPEPTILTKWGRLTGAQWQEAKNREAMEKWWTPELEAYVAENWPSPEQLAVNQRHWAQQKRADRARNATAKAIASVARADRARPGSDSRSRSTTPTQLAIL